MDEIMNYEEEIMDNEIPCCDCSEEGSGMSTGLAMAIGAGVTLAIGGAIKLGKKLWQKYKDHKALKQPNEGETVEVTDEQINGIQPKKK